MTSPVPDIVASPTRKRLRQEETPVKKPVPNPPPKRRITKLGSHSQLCTPKFALSTSTWTPPDPTHPGYSSQSSSFGIPPPALARPGPSSPQINSSTNTPNRQAPVNYNGYARAEAGYDPLHQSPWHEFKYAKHNPTEPSSILYFERQRQIARNEADNRARIVEKKRIEAGVAAAAATIPPIVLPRPTKTLARVQKAATPAPARRIHDPYLFMSERKPTRKPLAGPGFTFGGNLPDSRSYSPFVFNPIVSSHSTPTRTHSVGDTSAATPAAILAQTPAQKDSRMANFTATAVAGAARFYVEADSIVNSLARSYSLAKAALVGNRDSKTAERRASQKVAIRKRIEEEERVRRKELFEEYEEFEAQTAQKNREYIDAAEGTSDLDGGSAAGSVEDAASRGERMIANHDVELPTERDLEFNGANGDPSFITEDTIPDTVFSESVHVSETTDIMSSSPIVRVDVRSVQSSPILSSVFYTSAPVTIDKHEESSTSSSTNEDSDGMEIIEPPKLKQVQQVISLDSDDEVEEIFSASNPHLTLGSNHHNRFEHVEDEDDDDDDDEEEEEEEEEELIDGSEGEYDEYDEYNEEYDGGSDEEEAGEFEDDEEGDEEIEDTFISIVKSKKFVGESESEFEEIGGVTFSESAGNSSSRSDSDDDEKGGQTEKDEPDVQPRIDYEYIEEETEKDDSDAEGDSQWKVKAKFPENVERSADFSLDSTVVIGSSSKQISYKESTPETPTPAHYNVVPEITITSPTPMKAREPTPVPDQEDYPTKSKEERLKMGEFTEADFINTDDAEASDFQGVADDGPEEEYFDDPRSEKDSEEVLIPPRRTCIYRVGNDVFNQNDKYIGKCRDDGFVEALDTKIIGWMSALGEFHRLQTSLDLRTREITEEEAYAYPDGIEEPILHLHEGEDFGDEKFEYLTLSSERQEALGMANRLCPPELVTETVPDLIIGVGKGSDGMGGGGEKVDVQEGEIGEIKDQVTTGDEQGIRVEQDDKLEDEEGANLNQDDNLDTYDTAITDGGGGVDTQRKDGLEENNNEIMADIEENDDQAMTADESGVVWQDGGPGIYDTTKAEDGTRANTPWENEPEEINGRAVTENKEDDDRVTVVEEEINVKQNDKLETYDTAITEDEEMVDVQQECEPEEIDNRVVSENKENDYRAAIEDGEKVNVGQDKFRTRDAATIEIEAEVYAQQNDDQVTGDGENTNVGQDDAQEVSVEQDDKPNGTTTEDEEKTTHGESIALAKEPPQPFFGPPQQTTYELLRQYTSEAAAWQIRQVNGHEPPFTFQCDSELTKAFGDEGVVAKRAPESEAQVKRVISGGEGTGEVGGVFGGESEGGSAGEDNRNGDVEEKKGGEGEGEEEEEEEEEDEDDDDDEEEEEEEEEEGDGVTVEGDGFTVEEADGVGMEGEGVNVVVKEEEGEQEEEEEVGVVEEEEEKEEEGKEEKVKVEMLAEDQVSKSAPGQEVGKGYGVVKTSVPAAPPLAHEPITHKRKRLVLSPVNFSIDPSAQAKPKRHIKDKGKYIPLGTSETGSPTAKRSRTTPVVAVEPSPMITRKRAREASIEPVVDEVLASPKKLRRGRSASVEPSVPIAVAGPKSRRKKAVAAKALSGGREVVVTVEADAATAMAHSRRSSADLSADDTDTSVRGLRRSARAAAKGVVPGTPGKKRVRKYPAEPLSAIREAEAEVLVGKGATRISTRRKGAGGGKGA